MNSDIRYLAPLQAAHAAITHVISRLRVALSDPLEDPPVGPIRLDQVERLAAADLAELDRIVNLQQDGRSADALTIVRGSIGYDLMADLRGMISTMVADEQDRLASRQQELQRQQAIAAGVSVTGAALATFLI